MTPARKPPGGVPDRAALDALRAQMEAAERAPRSVRRRGARRVGRTDGKEEDRARSEGDESAPGPEGPVDAATPLDDLETGRDAGADDGRWWDDHPGRPIPVEGGIAAATRRGRIGASWWSQRFLGSLEAVLVGGRPERGRAYARKGQVVSLALDPGVMAAVVQGSRDEPYRVRLTMPVASEDEWDRVVDLLGARAAHAARLLAGELPHEVEEVFAQAGTTLFPGPQARMVTECTCPDFENPCKHIAAVCYLVAERFDRDPFQVLRWRGRDRTEVVEALRRRRAEGEGAPETDVPASAGRAATDAAAGPADPEAALLDGTDLPAEGFWVAGPGLAGVHVRPVGATLADAVLRQLPPGVVTLGRLDVADVLAPAYEAFTAAAARRGGG